MVDVAGPLARRLAVSAGVAAVLVVTGHVLDTILFVLVAIIVAPFTGFDPIYRYANWLCPEPAEGDRP